MHVYIQPKAVLLKNPQQCIFSLTHFTSTLVIMRDESGVFESAVLGVLQEQKNTGLKYLWVTESSIFF